MPRAGNRRIRDFRGCRPPIQTDPIDSVTAMIRVFYNSLNIRARLGLGEGLKEIDSFQHPERFA